MDKATIVGSDGKAKYVLGDDNSITDLKDQCTCTLKFDGVPYEVDNEQRVCLVCGLKITKNP